MLTGKEVTMLPYNVSNHRQQWIISGNCLRNRRDPTEVLLMKPGSLFSSPTLFAAPHNEHNQQVWIFETVVDQSKSLRFGLSLNSCLHCTGDHLL